MPVIDPDISAYAEAHTSPQPQFMRDLVEETRESLPSFGMLSGLVEGRLLELLVWTSGARRILELGTYSGFSALSMAAALPEDGELITCELTDAHADFAQRHIDASPYGGRITIRRGPALETVAALEGPFDLIFIDAHKPEYPDYYEASLPLLAPRGLIVIDNTLWSGEVMDPGDGESVNAIVALNDRIVADERVVAVVLPVRDGITLVRHR